jgi:hypothetical protein
MRTLHANLVAHSTQSRGDESEQCCECGAIYQLVNCGGRPASYYVAQHAWSCPERKLRWPA